MIRSDACIEPIVFPPFPITEYLDKGLHIGIFLEVPKQLQHKEADRVIGKSQRFVCMGDEGSNKSEIYKGGDESGQPPTIRPSGCILMYLRW